MFAQVDPRLAIPANKNDNRNGVVTYTSGRLGGLAGSENLQRNLIGSRYLLYSIPDKRIKARDSLAINAGIQT